MSAYASSSKSSKSRNMPRFPGTNAHPTPQATTQVTVYPDYNGMSKSYNYYQKVMSNQKGCKPNFFTPKNVPIDSMLDVLSIKQYDPLFCLKKDLIGEYGCESDSFHSSAQVTMVKVRSAFNNLHFDDLSQSFFSDLCSSIFAATNEDYIAELINFMIHPVGFAKAGFGFVDSKTSKAGLGPLESENSGTISAKVQDKNAYLYHGTRVRWCVPTPKQFNDVGNWYTDDDIKGKITLYLEPITPETDYSRFATLFSGFFGNDCKSIENSLQEMIDFGHECLIPFHAIPVSLKHLISVIYLKTIQMDIESGMVEINNPYKYQSIAAFFQSFLSQLKSSTGGGMTRIEQMFRSILEDVKKESRVQTANLLISTYVKFIDSSIPPEFLRDIIVNIFNSIDGGIDADNNFIVEIYDLPDSFDFDFAPDEGYSEEDWDELLKKEGDKVLNWTRPLMYENNQRMKTPITKNDMEFTRPMKYSMFGEYILHDENTVVAGRNNLDEMSSVDVAQRRKQAAEDFFIVSAPIFGLAVPVPAKGDSSSRSDADGYHYSHHEDPDYQIMVEDATDRAERTVIEIAQTLCSELLPQHKCERSRVGYDHTTSTNIAMTVESITHKHVFNSNTEIGRISKEISNVFPQFLKSTAEYFYNEEQKPKLKVIRGGCRGEKATVYFKQ